MTSITEILSGKPSLRSGMPIDEHARDEQAGNEQTDTNGRSEGEKPEERERVEAKTVESKPETAKVDGEKPDGSDPEPGHLNTNGLRKALDAERKISKQRDRDAREFARQLKQLQAQNQELLQRTQPKPDPKQLDNEFFNGSPAEFIAAQARAQAEAVFQAQFSRHQQQIQIDSQIRSDEAYMRARHDDYEDAKNAFLEAAADNPELWRPIIEQAQSKPLAVYEAGKKFLTQDGGGTGDGDELSRLEARVAELRGEGQAKKTPRSIPKTNAGARGSGVSATSAFAGPTPMADILAPRRRAAR